MTDAPRINLPLADLPVDRMRRVDTVAGPILIARIGQEIFAIDDRCSHEDASLSTGKLADFRVKCPLHGSWFCLRTGVPLDEPADEAVRTYPVKVEDDMVTVSLTPR